MSARLGGLALSAVAWATATAQGSVTGTVFDSLRTSAFLGGATIVIPELSRFTDADARGRFRFDSVPAGKYTITFLHSALDSLDIGAEAFPLEVAERGTTNVRLSTPSLASVYARLCRAPRPPETGLVIGHVRDVDEGNPAADAIVSARWTEYTLSRDQRVRPQTVRAVTRTNASGAYVLCGVPTDASVDVVALIDGFGAGPALVSANAIPILRLNLSISRRDSAAKLTPEVLADTARQDTPIASLSGGASISGRLRGTNGEPARGAIVSLVGSTVEVRADSNGRFHMPAVPAGTRMVQVRAIGAEPALVAFDLRTGAALDTTIILAGNAQHLAAASVVGKRPAAADNTGFEARRQAAIGYYVTEETIKKAPSRNMLSILDAVPSLKLMCPRGACVILQRGYGGPAFSNPSNLCKPTFFVDNMEVSQGDAANRVQNEAIKGIEVYTAAQAMPPQYDRSGRTNCGSIVIWTKFMAGGLPE